MSYDVDTWKTKNLVDLVIPVESLLRVERDDWRPRRERLEDGSVSFTITEDCWIRGTVEIVDYSELLRVTAIQMSGDGSGTALRMVIEPALKDSRGILVAARVWEGGDMIDRLTVVDGAVSTELIEI